MNNILKIVLLLLLFQSCKEGTIKVPKDSKVITKFRVLDEFSSPINTNCSEESTPFLQMEKYACSFSVDKYEFDIERKYSIDDNGELKEYSTYLPEGPLTYSIKELNNDLKFKKHENLENFNVGISKNRTEILDGNKRLKIEAIFEKEKLILIINRNKTELKGRRIIYEYN